MADLSERDIGENRDQQLAQIYGVVSFCIVLATSSIVFRLVFRKISKLKWMADDYFMILATLFSNADAVSYIYAANSGYGQHIYELLPEQIGEFFKIVFITEQWYGAAVTCVKISVLLFYRRIFPSQGFRKWLVVLGIISILWEIVISLTSAFQCTPVAKAWDNELEGICIPFLDLYIGIQVSNIILDTVILALPISAVMKLQMSRANKISVGGMFALGGVSIVIAIVRLAILVTDIHETDITYATQTGLWSLIEPSVEIFSACLPCMGPVLKAGRYFSKVRSFQSIFRFSKSSDRQSQDESHFQSQNNRHLQRHGINFTKYQDKALPSTSYSTTSEDIPLERVVICQMCSTSHNCKHGL